MAWRIALRAARSVKPFHVKLLWEHFRNFLFCYFSIVKKDLKVKHGINPSTVTIAYKLCFKISVINYLPAFLVLIFIPKSDNLILFYEPMCMHVCLHVFSYTLFFIRTSNFRLRLGCSSFFGDVSLKLFLNCSYFLIFVNSKLVAWNNRCKMALKKIYAWNCQYSVRERDELAYHSSSARWRWPS